MNWTEIINLELNVDGNEKYTDDGILRDLKERPDETDFENAVDITELYNNDEEFKKLWDEITSFFDNDFDEDYYLKRKVFEKESLEYILKSMFFGVAVGDALGVPFEFLSRRYFDENKVTDMVGFRTHNQPLGTFSDDSSLTFCLAESLIDGYNPTDMAEKFVAWYHDGYWTAHGSVFDIGYATRRAIERFSTGTPSLLSGCTGENENGNGSLMRIAPLVFLSYFKSIEIRFLLAYQVSSITHRHIRSAISCFIYLEFILLLIKGKDKFEAFKEIQSDIPNFLSEIEIPTAEIEIYNRLFSEDFISLNENEIYSSGYVVHTLEASIWCFLNTDSYEAAVLKAVNLGDDTDTTAAVTGAMAGIYYGFDNIPDNWTNVVTKKEEILDLAKRMTVRFRIFM